MTERRSLVGGWPIAIVGLVLLLLAYTLRYTLVPFVFAIMIGFVLDPVLHWSARAHARPPLADGGVAERGDHRPRRLRHVLGRQHGVQRSVTGVRQAAAFDPRRGALTGRAAAA